jgi:D-alanyl-D-alanine carboxypeptidase/D-alanyl-D-alanine-endopeptidase (penicillin-binding protein 4)
VIGRLVKQVLPPAVLAVVALVAWQSANRADFDPVDTAPVEYEKSLTTPMLSARRIPRTLRAPISDDLAGPGVDELIARSPSGQVCVSVRNGDRPIGATREVPGGLIPASNQKLLTTYAALGILGPDYTFTTRVMTTTPTFDGVIDGDLYLVGDGDPFLFTDGWLDQYEVIDGRSHTRLEDLADRVVEAGVTSVAGSIVGDESRYDIERYGPWDGRLIDQQQSGPMSALTVNENFVTWPATFRDSFRARSESSAPPVDAAAVFADLLQERGVTIAGRSIAGVTPEGAVEIASIRSPELTDTITHINSYSSNIGAELLMKRLGLTVLGVGSTAAGAAAVTDYLAAQGISMDNVTIFDGSGLAESNRLTCTAVAEILARTGPASPFGQSLSVSGERGSLLARFIDSPAEGQVRAKTGTLRNVRALSGYVESSVDSYPGTYLTFAYILNDDEVIDDDAYWAIQDPFVSFLTEYPDGPTLAELGPEAPTSRS